MGTRYDIYVRTETWLHRLDARVKFVGICVGILVSLLTTDLVWIVAYFSLSCVLIILTRVTWVKLSAIVYTLVMPVTIMITILYPITSPPVGGPVLWQWWIITVTLPNVLTGVSMALRLATMTLISYSLLFTTTQRDLVRALVDFGLPYKYGFVVASTLRYLPAFENIITQITEAQKARALDLKKGGIVQRGRNYVPLLGAAMITSFRLADQLANALGSRAFGAPVKRTYLTDPKLRPTDFVALAIIVALFGTFLAGRFFLHVIA
jgi:energy-coupling factor transport system permease protein